MIMIIKVLNPLNFIIIVHVSDTIFNILVLIPIVIAVIIIILIITK